MLLGAEAAARRRGVTSELTSGENFTVLSFFTLFNPSSHAQTHSQ